MISLEKEGLAQWRSPTSIVVVLESVNWLHRLFDYDNDKRCADNDHEGGLCTPDDSSFTKKGLCIRNTGPEVLEGLVLLFVRAWQTGLCDRRVRPALPNRSPGQ